MRRRLCQLSFGFFPSAITNVRPGTLTPALIGSAAGLADDVPSCCRFWYDPVSSFVPARNATIQTGGHLKRGLMTPYDSDSVNYFYRDDQLAGHA